MPRSASPALDGLTELPGLVRVVDPLRVGVGAEIDRLVPEAVELLEDRLA